MTYEDRNMKYSDCATSLNRRHLHYYYQGNWSVEVYTLRVHRQQREGDETGVILINSSQAWAPDVASERLQ